MVALEASKPFRNLSRIELEALRRIAQERSYPPGTLIFKEGDSGDGIYVVNDGAVEISVAINQNLRRVFAKIGPGEIFGEMAVLEFKPRSATAVSAAQTQAYLIPRNELLLMLERTPVLSMELLRDQPAAP